MYNIRMINIDKLHPHPQNPRKDLGDLTELADSIRVNGVLQNLTVVERGDGDYTVIIGHRRTAAAKKAGCTELPCAVVQMTDNEQLETMLLENMQRSDLTIVEEAQGLQLLIDLGESVGELADKTGFSKTKIRNRLRLNQYKPDSVVKAFSQGATLEDYAKLDKIKDPKCREKVAGYLGRSDFNYLLDREIKRETFENDKPAILALVKELGIEYVGSGSIEWFKRFKTYTIRTLDEFKKAIEEQPGRSFALKDGYGICFTEFELVALKTKEELHSVDQGPYESPIVKKKKQILNDYRSQVIKECKERIASFVRHFDEAEFCDRSYNILKIHVAKLVAALYSHEIWNQNASDPYESEITIYWPLEKIMGYVYDDLVEKSEGFDDVDAKLRDDNKLVPSIMYEPLKYLLAIVAGMIDFRTPSDYFTHNGAKNMKIDYNRTYIPRAMIDILKGFGFVEPEIMQQYIDGTHPMYTEEGCEKIIATALGEEET